MSLSDLLLLFSPTQFTLNLLLNIRCTWLLFRSPAALDVFLSPFILSSFSYPISSTFRLSKPFTAE